MKPVQHAVLQRIIRKGRRQAHDELSELFRDGDEAGAMELALQDPSLFTEPLDSRVCLPIGDARRAGYVPGRGTNFTWAMTAAECSMAELMGALLDAGVHPCDPEVFIKVPLLSHSEWFFRPENCARVLQLGADPDSPMDADREWLALGTSTVGQWLVKRLAGGGGSPLRPMQRSACTCSSPPARKNSRRSQVATSPSCWLERRVATHRRTRPSCNGWKLLPV